MEISKKQLLYSAGLLLAGLLIGWLLFSGSPGNDRHTDHNTLTESEMDQHVDEQHTDEEGNIVWTCSMHPQVREEEPGNCPICGMELIPAGSQGGEAEEGDYSMVMTASATRLADIQTTPVVREVPQKTMTLPGRVQVDERRITRVTTHFPGRIRDLKIDFTGAQIRKGEVMATIYSPELIAAQRELLEAARQKERNPRLYESTRQKFRLWEFTDEQIQAIEDRGTVQNELEILSPANGYVLNRNIAEEQHVTEGTVIYEVANLEQVWVVLEAYEEDIQWIRQGDPLSFRTRGNPSQKYEATVNWIDPVMSPQKRTVGVRADVSNPDGSLKPDMLVSGVLQGTVQEEKLLVPASSVLWTGPRSLVYVQDISADVPRFEVREVELGPKTGDHYIIEDGVEEGEEVVFHGAFRIDSEMQLADRFSMMNREPGSGAVPRGHDHGSEDMDMEDMDEEEDHSEHTDAASSQHFDDVPDDFRQTFSEAIEQYISGKDALITSDLSAAQNAYSDFNSKLEEIGIHGLSGSGHTAWMDSFEALTGHASDIVSANDIEQARASFRNLSDELIDAVQTFGIEGVVYHQYCPMAFDNEGANWLSREEQIQNPYLPENMLTCGDVIESIE
jgi:membrane fusion protein, copper/silver efflux system